MWKIRLKNLVIFSDQAKRQKFDPVRANFRPKREKKKFDIIDHVLGGSLYSTVPLIFVPVGKLFFVFYNSLLPTKDCFPKRPINFYGGKNSSS